jgi:hypothetical protein
MKPAENYPTKTDYYSEFEGDLEVFQNAAMGKYEYEECAWMGGRLGFRGEFLN